MRTTDTITIVTEDQLRQMNAYKPLVENRNEQMKVKESLINGIKEAYADKWQRLKEETRRVIDELAFLAAERGFSFAGVEYLAEKCGAGVRTVQRVFEALIDAGQVVKLYRRNPKGNSVKNNVLLFTKHAYFAYWSAEFNLAQKSEKLDDGGLDGEQENYEKPCESKNEDAKKNPTIGLTDYLESEKHIRISEYETICKAANVPPAFYKQLESYFDAQTVINAWIGIKRTCAKYKADYSVTEIMQLISIAAAKGVHKYKKAIRSGNNLNVIRFICGTLKRMFKDDLAATLRAAYGEIKEFWSNSDMIGLAKRKQEIAQLEGVIRRITGAFSSEEMDVLGVF